jgi:6,7-dimethyl-8-ribityllumazine synthase
MLKAAEAHAKKLGVEVVAVVRVPGVWELPLAVKSLLAREDVDAVVAIGAVVKGGTEHDELIARTVAIALMFAQVDAHKPVGLGITGPGMTWAQAEARIANAARAVDAAVRMAEHGNPRLKGRTGPRRARKGSLGSRRLSARNP